MYPNDAKTLFLNANANGTGGTLLSSTSHIRTLLNVGLSCNTGTNNAVLIGSNQIAFIKNNSNVYKTISTPLPINTTLTYTKTNTADCFFTIVYTDYDLSTMGTGSPAFFSGDGLFTSFLLFIGLIMALTAFVWAGLKSIKVHNNIEIRNSEGKHNFDI